MKFGLSFQLDRFIIWPVVLLGKMLNRVDAVRVRISSPI